MACARSGDSGDRECVGRQKFERTDIEDQNGGCPMRRDGNGNVPDRRLGERTAAVLRAMYEPARHEPKCVYPIEADGQSKINSLNESRFIQWPVPQYGQHENSCVYEFVVPSATGNSLDADPA